MAKKKLTILKLLLFYVVFWAVWAVRELWLPHILAEYHGLWVFELCQGALKLLVWTLPSVLLVGYYKEDAWLSRGDMLSNKVKWLPYLGVIAGFAAYNILAALTLHKHLRVHEDFRIVSLLGYVVFVGVTEEAVFRGFFLNMFLKKMKTWQAVGLTALLFLVIHFPIWQYNGILKQALLSGNFLGIIGLSVIFSWAFMKSKSIWPPILLHMCWNLFVTILNG